MRLTRGSLCNGSVQVGARTREQRPQEKNRYPRKRVAIPVIYDARMPLSALLRQLVELVEQRALLFLEFAIPGVEPIHLASKALQPLFLRLPVSNDVVVVQR